MIGFCSWNAKPVSLACYVVAALADDSMFAYRSCMPEESRTYAAAKVLICTGGYPSDVSCATPGMGGYCRPVYLWRRVMRVCSEPVNAEWPRVEGRGPLPASELTKAF